MVTINKKWQNNPPSIVKKAKHFYMDTMCNCASLENGSIINCIFPQTAPMTKNSKSHGHDDDQDLQELIRLPDISSKKGGGTRVEVDSKRNFVWKNSGRMGGITVPDWEEWSALMRTGLVSCDFKETDVTKVWYTRNFGSHKGQISIKSLGHISVYVNVDV